MLPAITSLLLPVAALFVISAQVLASAQEMTPPLQDIDETIVTEIKVKYPPGIQLPPELAQRLTDETEKVIEDGGGTFDYRYYNSTGYSPHYSMHYELVAETPEVVAVFGQGTIYEGGAHHQIMMSSHIWLPKRQEWLTAQNLLTGPDGWQALSDFVGHALLEEEEANIGNIIFPPGQDLDAAQQTWRDGRRDWIRSGTAPDNLDFFGYFQPLMADNGRIRALKFVFPPYQVGSWADGVREVTVPAHILSPYLPEYYQHLFVRP